MNVRFQYLKIPYGENILTLLGSEGFIESHQMKAEPHFHNLMEIAICRSGSGEIYFDNVRFDYKKDDVIVIPKNFSHTICSYPGEKCFWEYIYLKPSVILDRFYEMEARKKEKLLEEMEQRPFLKTKKEARMLVSELDLVMEQCRTREYEWRNCINGLLIALLIEIAKLNHRDHIKPEFEKKVSPKKVETLSAALEYIEENFAQDLRISDIAQAAYVSETYLRRLFAECCDTSPMHYTQMIRIENACDLLEKRDININEVAFKVGYTNISTFINNFKCITGETPKQWRQNKKKNKAKKPGNGKA